MLSSWASALQSTIAQAQEAVTSAQGVAFEASKDFFKMENAQNEEETEEQGMTAASTSSGCPLACPSGISPLHWNIVLDVAFRDGNFFIIPPSRVMSESAEALARVGVLEACKATAILTPDELTPALLGPLATHEAITKLHYAVMPRFVADEQFWINGLWRLAVLRCCTSMAQLADTYEVITREKQVAEPRPKLRGCDNGALCSELRSRVLAAQESVDWLRERQRAADECLKNAGGSYQLLGTFVAKRQQSDLSDSVFESCKYHKTRLASLIGELEGHSNRLEGTDLDTRGDGERFAELLQQNEELHTVINAYVALLQSLKEEAAQQSSPITASRDASPSAVPVSASGAVVDEPRVQQTVNDPTARGGAGSDDEFNVQLPWEDEDDE